MKITSGTSSIGLVGAGLLFAVLWASASAATKIGLESAQPFMIAIARFGVAAVVMLLLAHLVLRKRLPAGKEWQQLSIYGLLNITIYLGLYVIAMQYVSAGLATLAIAVNPVFISLIAAVWFKQPVDRITFVSLALCMAGILVAAYPLLLDSYATPGGLALLLTSMLSYSAGALYFSQKKWNDLHILTINGWQTLLGGIFLLPFVIIFYEPDRNLYDGKWLGSVLWLALAVSITAVQLWLFLLKDNPVKAAFWLFLCPVFGFVIAALLMHEPVDGYTFVGVVFVIVGLYLVQRKQQISSTIHGIRKKAGKKNIGKREER